jgi:hypothetical protein
VTITDFVVEDDAELLPRLSAFFYRSCHQFRRHAGGLVTQVGRWAAEPTGSLVNHGWWSLPSRSSAPACWFWEYAHFSPL